MKKLDAVMNESKSNAAMVKATLKKIGEENEDFPDGATKSMRVNMSQSYVKSFAESTRFMTCYDCCSPLSLFLYFFFSLSLFLYFSLSLSRSRLFAVFFPLALRPLIHSSIFFHCLFIRRRSVSAYSSSHTVPAAMKEYSEASSAFQQSLKDRIKRQAEISA
jgi:hypothetical protein